MDWSHTLQFVGSRPRRQLQVIPENSGHESSAAHRARITHAFPTPVQISVFGSTCLGKTRLEPVVSLEGALLILE
jgi:hypothetical protein